MCTWNSYDGGQRIHVVILTTELDVFSKMFSCSFASNHVVIWRGHILRNNLNIICQLTAYLYQKILYSQVMRNSWAPHYYNCVGHIALMDFSVKCTWTIKHNIVKKSNWSPFAVKCILYNATIPKTENHLTTAKETICIVV